MNDNVIIYTELPTPKEQFKEVTEYVEDTFPRPELPVKMSSIASSSLWPRRRSASVLGHRQQVKGVASNARDLDCQKVRLLRGWCEYRYD